MNLLSLSLLPNFLTMKNKIVQRDRVSVFQSCSWSPSQSHTSTLTEIILQFLHSIIPYRMVGNILGSGLTERITIACCCLPSQRSETLTVFYQFRNKKKTLKNTFVCICYIALLECHCAANSLIYYSPSILRIYSKQNLTHCTSSISHKR